MEYKPVQFTEAKGALLHGLTTMFKKGFQERQGQLSAQKFLSQKDEMKSVFRGAIPSKSSKRDSRRACPKEWRRPLYDRQEGLCALCGETIDLKRIEDGGYVHMDHILSHSRSGKTSPENVQLCHMECNQKKGASLAHV